MDAQDGDVGAVHRAAHVQAAGQRDAQLRRQVLVLKRSYSASITALTMPEASVAGEWQWIHPWVCTMLLSELAVPPTGNPELLQFLLQRLDVVLVIDQELDVVAAGEAEMPAAVLVGQVGKIRSDCTAIRRGVAARTV